MADDTKVRSIFEKKKEEPPKPELTKEEQAAYDFEADMERNRKLKERKAKERLEANKGVLRSYRIKH